MRTRTAGNPATATSCSVVRISGPGVPTLRSSSRSHASAARRCRARARVGWSAGGTARGRAAPAAGCAAGLARSNGHSFATRERIAPTARPSRYRRCTRSRSAKNGSSGILTPRLSKTPSVGECRGGRGSEEPRPPLRLRRPGLPGRLGHAGQLATVGHVTEADARDAELREDTAGAAVDDVAAAHAHR